MVADGSSGDFTTAELPCRWDELTRFRSIDVVDDVPLEMPPGGGVGWPQLWEERLAGLRSRYAEAVAGGRWPRTGRDQCVASDIGLAVVTPSTAAVTARGRGHITDLTGESSAGLPPAAAMAGVVQPRGHEGVTLRCLVCGHLFVAKRRDRRTCSPRCARRDRAARRMTLEALDGAFCEECDRVFVGGRADRRYCQPRCRARACRRRRREQAGLS